MRIISSLILYFIFSFAYGQSAKEVLDKTAATVSNKGGAQASFTISGQSMNASGTIAIKDKKFHATTPQASIWFDGKTQWTYMKNNDEVNVTTPTESQLQAINPYNFINLYKNGYDATLNSSGKDYVVHLTASTKDKKIRELFITVNKSSNTPTQVKLLQGTKWTIFDISDLKKQSVPDSQFRFNAKDFPQAEIIDLR